STRELKSELSDPTKDLLTYRKPAVTLLEDYVSSSEVSEQEIFENKSKIEETLANFGIPIQKIKATVGPTVTLYEIVQAQGVKIAKIQGLEQDIAQSLKALGIRIIAPIPGKGTIGIEVPNQNKQIVSMYSAVRSKRFFEFAQKAELPVVIGRTIQNENFCFDLAKLPHLLVAGATGQGKSVGLNAIITSLLYHKHPSQLKLVMIDPKMVEFSVYGNLERHFLAKMESEDKAIVTDPMKAVYTLNSLCTEMDSRLELLSKATSRNIVEYNTKFTERRLNPEKGHRYLPYIVVVVDEFADLIMMAREVERPVMRLAQKARAVGIHLIIATQRPDVKVITGGIKANFPARIAFRVMQMIDSRTILDRPGANQLIGRGDMLFSKDGEVTRIQCALVETKEVERIVEYIAKQQGYTEAYALPDYVPEGGDAAMGSEEQDLAPKKYDSLFAEIARDAVQSGSISTSMIQRNYEVGFNRAGRIMMQLERAGVVGRQQGAKPRDVLFHDLQSLEAKLQDLGLF
ncbi:MAG: DNA translocase FtsK, partial [Alistipes sp.]|nr:DNA translocase FtsK [Alistipes sp.]